MAEQIKRVAVVGATGLVGQEFMRQLDTLTHLEEIRLIASEDSKGELFQVGGLECQVTTLESDSFQDIDVVFLAAPGEICKLALEYAAESGALVVDATQPLGVAGDHHIVLPDPVTTLTFPVVKAFAQQSLQSITICTYHAVSGAGRAGVDELWGQTLAIFNQTDAEQAAFEQNIAFNCIPQIDVMNEQGMTRMEGRVGAQLLERIVPSKPLIMITGVRVPCLFGISAVVTAHIEDFDFGKFEADIQSEDVEYHRDPAEVITPIQVIGDGKIHISRVRQQDTLISVWLTADNIQACLVSQAMKYVSAD